MGAINSDSTDVLMDTVTVIDPDPGEDMLVEQSATATEYGTFSILPSGTWEYTLDTTNPTIAAMVQGDRLTDTIQISSIDGTTAELVITINGVGGAAPSGENNVAVIIDTDPGDTGELRYALGADGPLAAGRLEVKVKRLDDDLGDGDAFITLFNENTNNDGAILDFRIRDRQFWCEKPKQYRYFSASAYAGCLHGCAYYLGVSGWRHNAASRGHDIGGWCQSCSIYTRQQRLRWCDTRCIPIW